MSYLEQLKSENTHLGTLSKLPKPPFDSFDSRGRRHFSEKKAPSAVDINTDDGPPFTDAAIYQGIPTPTAIDRADEMLKYIADQQRPCTEAEIVEAVGGDGLMARNILNRLAVDGDAEALPGGMFGLPPYPPRPADLPKGCPLRVGAPIPKGCRFEARLFHRMMAEGTLPLPGGRCPLRTLCRVGSEK
jgi:hypothetical protein